MKNNIEINLTNMSLKFEIIPICIINRNIENIFVDNKKTLLATLKKAISDPKNRLHSLSNEHINKYSEFHNHSLGDFILYLKNSSNSDYKLYLNKYGDSKFCSYKIKNFLKDKGIYCYIVNDEIKYIGRCKKSFKIRINNDYGKITPYNCLINGQSTNCNINSRINNIYSVRVGIYVMTNKTDCEIMQMEKLILSQNIFEWNIQKI